MANHVDGFERLSQQISALSSDQGKKFEGVEKLLQQNKEVILENSSRLDSVEDQLLDQQRRSRKE